MFIPLLSLISHRKISQSKFLYLYQRPPIYGIIIKDYYFVFLAILFDIPIEVSTDIVSLLSLAIGVISFMDITNSIGGLGVLGVRALHLSGRETLLHIKNSNLIISALGSSPETPLFSKRR